MLEILTIIYVVGAVLSALFFLTGILMFANFIRQFPEDSKWLYELLRFWLEIAGKHILLWPWYMVGRPIHCLIQIKRGKMEPLNI